MKKLTIEQLLTWAFTQELCKAGSGVGSSSSTAWNMMSEVALLGTVVDRSPNGFGVIPGFVYEGEPHADAMMVGQHVRGLADADGFDVAEGWNPFPDWKDEHGLVKAEVERVVAETGLKSGRLNGKHVVNLVITCAILGRGPDWRADEPKTFPFAGPNGKDAWFIQRKAKDRDGKVYAYEDSGYDRAKSAPLKGAYRKWKLDEPVHGSIVARLEWQLWQSALESLQESLAGRLKDVSLYAFTPDRHPWMRMKRPAISA